MIMLLLSAFLLAIISTISLSAKILKLEVAVLFSIIIRLRLAISVILNLTLAFILLHCLLPLNDSVLKA